ncbi:MAG: 4-hydroxyphenylpyruvate dioxygenase [Bdellovibrionota bacterium]|nr:4-hydroxyphenylpyruvate dioxygenase [Bdellovibrionota bacterium]
MSEWLNPVGLDGMDFVEFADTDKKELTKIFTAFGFEKIADHKEKQIELWRQGDINFLLNTETTGFAAEFCKMHGPSVCSMGFRVKSAPNAVEEVLSKDATLFNEANKKSFLTDYPTIFGIGDSLIYFIETYGEKGNIFEDEYNYLSDRREVKGKGFQRVDHLTNNVPAGDMQKWCDWYSKIFNFQEKRYFDIHGSKTGLTSKVMMSPCRKIMIPVNEPSDEKSQIQEYLDEYKGSGVQHIALLTNDIVSTLTDVRKEHDDFLNVPSTYYEDIPNRLENVEENLAVLEKLGILVDGDDEGYLLQIFTQNLCGPIFFEVIERKNHHGFGEGNFQALFEAIERDQERRGVL